MTIDIYCGRKLITHTSTTYTGTEWVRKLITVSLILNDFSCGKSRYLNRLLFCSKPSFKGHLHACFIFSHNLHSLLEVAWKIQGIA